MYGYDDYTTLLWSHTNQTLVMSLPSCSDQSANPCHMYKWYGPIRPLHVIHGYFGPIRSRTQVLNCEYIPTHTLLTAKLCDLNVLKVISIQVTVSHYLLYVRVAKGGRDYWYLFGPLGTILYGMLNMPVVRLAL